MPQLLPNNAAVNTVAIPSAAQPVAQKPRPQDQPQQAQPQQPVDPFKQQPGPPILLLPWEQSQQQPVQSMRARVREAIKTQRAETAIRMGHHDNAPLFEHVRANPLDDAPWLILADSLEESGKPHMANFLRGIGSNSMKINKPDMWTPHRQYVEPAGEEEGGGRHPERLEGAMGHIAGVPIAIRAHKNWSIVQFHHQLASTRSGKDNWEPAVAYVSHDTADRLASEIDDPQPQRWSKEGQPIKLAHPDEHAAFLNGIAANPQDDAHRLIYSDFLEENGHPALADAYRRTAYNGQVPWYGSTNGSLYSEFYGEHPGIPGHGVQVEVYDGHAAQSPIGKDFARIILGEKKSHPESRENEQFPQYETDDMDHVRHLLSELHPVSLQGMGSERAHAQVLRSTHGTEDGGPSNTRSMFRYEREGQAEKFAVSAPRGGFLFRGLMYLGGERLPEEADPTASQPAPQPTPTRKTGPKRDRLRKVIGSRAAAKKM